MTLGAYLKAAGLGEAVGDGAPSVENRRAAANPFPALSGRWHCLQCMTPKRKEREFWGKLNRSLTVLPCIEREVNALMVVKCTHNEHQASSQAAKCDIAVVLWQVRRLLG